MLKEIIKKTKYRRKCLSVNNFLIPICVVIYNLLCINGKWNFFACSSWKGNFHIFHGFFAVKHLELMFERVFTSFQVTKPKSHKVVQGKLGELSIVGNLWHFSIWIDWKSFGASESLTNHDSLYNSLTWSRKRRKTPLPVYYSFGCFCVFMVRHCFYFIFLAKRSVRRVCDCVRSTVVILVLIPLIFSRSRVD